VWYILGFENSSHDLLKSVLGFVATVIVAMLSWHLFESPINSLKRYFSYRIGSPETLLQVASNSGPAIV
jgi:peptidoglycan/LPS O-acetylase OafA/YrhL